MVYPLSMLLILANILVLILSVFRPFSNKLRWWPVAILLMAFLQLAIDGFYQTLILVYFITAILITIGFYRWKHPAIKSRFGFLKVGWAILWRFVCVICLVISVLFTWSFGKSNTFIASLFLHSHVDYSNLEWSEAFNKMNGRLSKDYAFGEWKSIDWDSLYNQFGKQVTAAQQAGDTSAYYLALRKYLFSIPDGHISLKGNDFGLEKAAISGGFGFAAIRLDDGRVVVHIIKENSPAAKEGMKWGDEILTWNDEPILTAVQKVPILWTTPCATLEGQQIRKFNHLTRAPVGTSVSITFRNSEDTTIKKISLTAIDDSLATYHKDIMMGMPVPSVDRYIKPVKWRILSNGYGYLKIIFEIPTLGDLNPVGTVRKAVKEFIASNVPGIVIDLRFNGGGIDEMATMMMSYFVTEHLLYETVAIKDEKSGKFKIAGELSLDPSMPSYTGPIALLISKTTNSTGEGFPLILKLLKRGTVFGFYGTSGSFGITGSSITLPGGYIVEYPNTASLDKDGNIQIDGNHLMQGGVLPDVRIPINLETLRAIFVNNKDIVLDIAIAAMKNDGEK